jgi:DNA-binding transcriptional MerR regulator
MKIGELARRTGLSMDTIRYYERIGLLPRADRNAARQRDYDPSILTWIAFLRRLKTTGMPIRDMVRYAALRAQGEETVAQRGALLRHHRDAVQAHLDELHACLDVLDSKIAGYAGSTREDVDHDPDDQSPNPAHDAERGQ